MTRTTEPTSLQGLRTCFGRTIALDGLDLAVQAGDVHGFLGPNGAGKKTTLRILLGLMRADAGTVTVLGKDRWRDAVDLHRGSPTSPATSCCGQHAPAVRRSTSWARPVHALLELPREARLADTGDPHDESDLPPPPVLRRRVDDP